jgi:manganese/zinc/iron transport system permease protein
MMPDWLLDVNTRWVLFGCALLGISSGALGTFTFLRRRSLIGDALAHAALPGVAAAFLLGSGRSLPLLLLGAFVAALLGALSIHGITRYSRIREDAALALVLSVFFGFGIVLLTVIQRTAQSSQSGLDKFMFGQAASLVGSDVRLMAASAAVTCVLVGLLFKELKLLCFDPGFGRGIGFRMDLVDSALMLLVVLVVIIGLQAVGVVLMAALLITPAAAARFWTDRLGVMTGLSAGFGALSGVLGTWGSLIAPRVPTGPLIVLAATGLFAISMLAAPRRGVIARLWRRARLRGRVARENALRLLFEAAESAGDWSRALRPLEFPAWRADGAKSASRELGRLAREGLVERVGDGFRLTSAGRERAYAVVRNHRLWEVFLMHEGRLASDHVDRDADLIEHHLPPEALDELERLLTLHGRSPGLPPSLHPLGSEAVR